jgi:type VI secretion system protein ImpA
MRYDRLLEAVSESSPCGPDLDESGDPDYLNYVLPATDKLPSRFYHNETGAPFDRVSVDLRGETKAIGALLDRSRDLRLLTLESRFQCLGGQIVGFAECLEAMAGLLDRHWEHVHPASPDNDHTMRQNTLSALDDRTTIILPLQYAPVSRDKKIGTIALRDYLIATGVVQKSANETAKGTAGELIDILRQPENIPEVTAIHAAILNGEKAIAQIRARFVESAGYEYVPDFVGVSEVFAQLRTMFQTALPELTPAEPSDAASGADADSADASGDSSVAAPRAADGVPIVATPVGSHAEATAALLAVEHYFLTTEPSSPSLILIHQARMLVGKSLVEALQILLPEAAEKALISFDAGVRFQLGMPKMKSISDTATAEAKLAPNGLNGHAGFVITTRTEAQSLLLGVDGFFRSTEPSSPIPMLLAKAKTYMNRDFAGILADLIKAEAPKTA